MSGPMRVVGYVIAAVAAVGMVLVFYTWVEEWHHERTGRRPRRG